MRQFPGSPSNSVAAYRILLALAACVLIGLACQPAPGGAGQATGAAIQSITHDGLDRTYRVLLPDQLVGNPALVVGLHGGGGDGEQFCSMGGGIAELIDAGGFVMVCPDGVEGHWNDGREIDTYRAHRERIDDVGFLSGLIERMTVEYGVDPGRIYVTGASNGGMMTYRMACDAPDKLSAAAALIANLPADLDCDPHEPTRILIINGADDPLMPFEGGSVTFLRREMGTVLSTRATFEFWAARSECNQGPSEQTLPDRDRGDGTTIVRSAYSDCNEDAEVVLYKVQGGGHTIPGGEQYAPHWLIGTVSHEFHAGRLVWDFFASPD